MDSAIPTKYVSKGNGAGGGQTGGSVLAEITGSLSLSTSSGQLRSIGLLDRDLFKSQQRTFAEERESYWDFSLG